MISSRRFKNNFSEEINESNENNDDGVFYTIRRFEQFINTLHDKIDADNKIILEEIKKEDEDVAISMLSQVDNSNNLNYFNDVILKSFLVSAYSYLEFKLNEFSEISEKHLPGIKKLKKFKKSVSDIEKCNSFLISEVIPQLIDFELDFKLLETWKDVRKIIVHYNSNIQGNNIDLSMFTSIKNEFDMIKIVDKKDLLDFLTLIEKYLGKIIDLINEKYNLIEYISINNNA